jgi:hypothetical protein
MRTQIGRTLKTVLKNKAFPERRSWHGDGTGVADVQAAAKSGELIIECCVAR